MRSLAERLTNYLIHFLIVRDRSSAVAVYHLTLLTPIYRVCRPVYTRQSIVWHFINNNNRLRERHKSLRWQCVK